MKNSLALSLILIDNRIKLWDTQKNIEEDVRLAPKRDGLEKEIRKDNLS